jgi:fructoselysine-6-P-deglycase FrlB-like protein
MPSRTAAEIATQPELWRGAASAAASHVAALPAAGAGVAVVGCGTSWFMGQAWAALRESAGHGRTDAFTPTELPAGRRYDHLVAISRSGTTTEVTRLLETAPAPASTAITAVAGSPVASAATHAIVLAEADETSVVQTRFATTALALLRAHAGGDLAAAATDAERALMADLPDDPASLRHVVFLGHGWSVGLANEAALKLREAAQLHTEAYPAMEYRHGPIAVAGDDTLVWIFSSPDPTVAADVRATGATVREATLDPMAELVLAQRLAVAAAEANDLDPDHPRHLTRSVVLA